MTEDLLTGGAFATEALQTITQRAEVSATGEISPAASLPATAFPAQKRVVSTNSV